MLTCPHLLAPSLSLFNQKLLEPVLKAGLRRLRHILMDTYVTCSQTMLSDQDTEYLGGEAQQPLDEILRRQWSSHIEEVCYEREKVSSTAIVWFTSDCIR